jgi:hypothetical protein
MIKETVEKDVTFLEDVDVQFVSLVRHGANQMPFRILKSEKEGGDGNEMNLIVQSILVPKHLELDELVGKEDLSWLAEANVSKGTDHDEYRTFDQAEVSRFDEATLKMVKVHNSGVWALVGSLKEGEEIEQAITLGQKEVDAAKEIPLSPMESPVDGPAVNQAKAVSFRDMFYKELDNMLSVVTGVLNQSTGEMGKRKKSVLSALDAFRSFVVIGLDSLQGEAAKIDTRDVTEEARSQKEEDMELFKTKEEFAGAVGEVVAGTVPGLMDEYFKGLLELEAAEKTAADAAAAEEEAKKNQAKKDDETQPDPEKEELKKEVAELKAKMEDLAKKWDNTPVTDGAGAANEDPPGKDTTKKEEKSVFSGLLYSADA